MAMKPSAPHTDRAASRPGGGRGRWRFNALCSVVLVLVALVLALRLTRGKANFVLDLTEEQLSRPSPVGVQMLRDLDEVLEVRAYFTGEVELGVAQLAKRRLVDQLEEVRRLASGQVALAFRDPNGSSEARAEALASGLMPQTVGAQRGSSAVSQDLYLGLVLRYAGREGVLPFVLPQSFEYAFLSEVRRLVRGSEPRVGLVCGRGDGAADDFAQLRELLSSGRALVELVDLDVKGAIDPELSCVLVVGPEDLHPRAVFALDQYVQGGGRLGLCVDLSHVDPSRAKVVPVDPGLDDLLSTWGVPLSARVVWDTERMNPVNTTESMEIAGRVQQTRAATVAYPAFVRVTPEGLNGDEVVTARLPGLDLFWAHPLLPPEDSAIPGGLERTNLAHSSPHSFAVPPRDDLIDLDPSRVQSRSIELLARSSGRTLPLGAILRGRFPSPFTAGAPAPFDPVRAALREEKERRAEESGAAAPPPPPLETTDEEVSSAASESLVVVLGDADWLRDPYLTPRNRMALEDLVDWLCAEQDLLALRARHPKERPLEDFLAEARAERGLPAMVAGEGIPAGDIGRLRLEEEAARAAARRRWGWTAAASGGALLGALCLGLLVHLFVFGRLPFGYRGDRIPKRTEEGH